MSMSCCMCEPMETAQSLGNDTHVRWLSGQRGHESTDYAQGAALYIGGL